MTARPPTARLAGADLLPAQRLSAAAWALCLCAALAGPAGASKAHEHGVVKLDVALEGPQLTLAVEMPLDSLLGFERAPRNDAERKAAAAALEKMRDGAGLFRLDTAAQCTLARATVEAPVLERAPVAGAKADEHAELEATYVFRCAQPARLAALEVLLFDAFRRVSRVDVQAALPHGQRKASLRRNARTVPLAR